MRLLRRSATKLIKVRPHVEILLQNAYLLNGSPRLDAVIKPKFILPARPGMLQGVCGGPRCNVLSHSHTAWV